MRIIRALQQDFPRLTEIWEMAAHEAYRFWSDETFRFYRDKIPAEYLPALELFAAWVPNSADPDIPGEVCGGFIGMGPHFDLTKDPDGGAKNGAQIFLLFVDPSLYRHGLGQALLDYAVKLYPTLNVDVYEASPDAQEFYLHRGFRVTGRSENDFEGLPYPVIHMRRGW